MANNIIKLYDKTGGNLIGELDNIERAKVIEERNGEFKLELTYIIGSAFQESLVEGNILVAKANDRFLDQKFRIYATKKMMSNRIEVFARHISYDLANDFIEKLDIVNQSCEYCLNQIFRNSQFSTNYRGYSDIINAQDYKISMVNALSAIMGTEGSIVDTFGTGPEILRDNTNIHVLERRGHDNGVEIAYSKNMTDITVDEDRTDLITRIYAYAKTKDTGGNEVVITAPNKYVDSPNIGLYSHPYVRAIDFTDKFKENDPVTPNQIKIFAEKYFRDNKCDFPRMTYKISFIPMSKTTEGSILSDGIELCDIVNVIDTRYGIKTKAKAIRTVFNLLTDRYDSIELGEPRATNLGITGEATQGPPGPPGPQGPPGADGNVGDFPDSLPSIPVLTAKVMGFASIDLSWTFEDKVYYTYEVYASKDKDFEPVAFDLIHEGQTSSFLYQVKPGETWYFRVCAKNSHGRRTAFSDQVEVITTKVDDMENYFTSAAIGHAVVGSLSADYMEAGIIKGNWIDAKNLSVTDGDGKRTFDIDSFGNVFIDSDNIRMMGETVSTVPYVDGKTTALGNRLDGFQEQITPDALKRTFSTEFYTKDATNANFTSKTEFEQNNREFLLKIEQTGRPQLIPNGALREGFKFWQAWQAQKTIEMFGGFKWATATPQFELGTQSFGLMMPEMEVQSGKVYTVGAWVSGDITQLNYNFLMQLKEGSMVGVQRIDSITVGDVSKQAKRVSVTFTALVTGYVQPMFAYEGVMNVNLRLRLAEACCFEGYFLYPYQEANNTIYAANAYVDVTGMGMRHDNGSLTRITHESFATTDIYERLKMAIKKGTLYAYDVDNGNLLGMFGSNKLNTKYKGVTTGIAGNSHYYAIGVSYELSDTSDLTMKPYMVIAQQDLDNAFGMSRLSAGVNFMNTPVIVHDIFYCKRFLNSGGLYSPNSILSLGYTDVTANYQTAFSIDGGSQRLNGFVPLDMHGWQIYNASLGYSVVNNENTKRYKAFKSFTNPGNIFDEIEVVNPSARLRSADPDGVSSIGQLDVSNVTNKDEIMLDDGNADLGKLVTMLFKEVKELKARVAELEALKK